MPTGRQKIEAAFSKSGSSEFAAIDFWEYVFVRDHWEQLTDLPWYHQFSPDLETQLAWRREVFACTRQDFVHLEPFYSRHERENLLLDVQPNGVFLLDRASGQSRKLEPPVPGGWSRTGQVESVTTPSLPTTPDELDAAVRLLPTGQDRGLAEDGRADLARALVKEHGLHRFPVAYADAPLWYLYELWGFEGMMLMIGEQPDLVKRACPHCTARALDDIRQAAILGASGVLIWECFSDMISLDAYESFSVPCMRRVVEECRSLGLRSIYGFSGNPAGKLEAICSIGADALAFEESKKGFVVDIHELAAFIDGRCTLFGNLDSINVLQDGSEADLRGAIAEQIAAGRRNRNRFVVSPGSPVTPATPAERVGLFCDLVHELSQK